MRNDHITVQKAACSSSATLKPAFKEQPSSQIKEEKVEEKTQTNLSLHCLLTCLKNKTNNNNLPNDIVALYYVLSLFIGLSFNH